MSGGTGGMFLPCSTCHTRPCAPDAIQCAPCLDIASCLDMTKRRPDGRRRGNRFDSGVLADWQIRELAEDKGMIEPFVGEPVREIPTNYTSASGEAMQPGSHPINYYDAKKDRGRKVVSYGLGHYGYDMRVAGEFKVFYPRQRYGISDLNQAEIQSPIVDPKALDEECFEDVEGDCIIPPNSFALARSLERFKIPRNVLAQVIGKSTYARCGLIVNVTPLEPEWEGYVTLEISNTTPLPARVYANEGIAQVLFFWASASCARSYKDKGGKYQDQPAKIITPRM